MFMDLEDEFGDIIQKARIGLRLSERQLAEISGLTEEQIAEIERYSLKPEDKVDILANVLKLNNRKLLNSMRKEFIPKPLENNNDEFEVFTAVSAFPSNAYIISYKKTKECLIIDTAGEPGVVKEKIDDNKLKPLAILLTHSHTDHIDGIKDLERVFNIKSYIFHSRLFKNESVLPLTDNQTLEFNNFKVKVLFTPGHTQDSCCFLIKRFCFTGDTIFAGSVGKPNWGMEVLLDSINNKIFTLSNDTVIFPGHGQGI